MLIEYAYLYTEITKLSNFFIKVLILDSIIQGSLFGILSFIHLPIPKSSEKFTSLYLTSCLPPATRVIR